MKYVTGTAKPLAEDDLKYEVWDAENSMVMSWLPYSMQPEINKTYCSYLLLKTLGSSVKTTPKSL